MPRINITLSQKEYDDLLKVKAWMHRITGMRPTDSSVARDLLMYAISIRLEEV